MPGVACNKYCTTFLSVILKVLFFSFFPFSFCAQSESKKKGGQLVGQGKGKKIGLVAKKKKFKKQNKKDKGREGEGVFFFI